MSLAMDTHLGIRLRQRRRLVGLTQKQLGAALGVRFQQVHKYECGESRISASRLWAVALILGVPMEYFFEGLETSRPRAEGLATGNPPNGT